MPETERDLAGEIATLDSLSLCDLRLRWQIKFGRTASTRLPKNLLLRLYAHRLQAEVYGDLRAGTIQLLDRLGTEKSTGDSQIPLPGDQNSRGQLKAGTVLVREHAGANHHVMVTKGGYCWNGQTYSSLSQVATAITGTRWSGPRFFGLKSAKAIS